MKMVNEAASGDSVKNGKARPGSPVTLNAPGSSNGQGGSESSDDENQGRIRVGREYQAVAPPYLPPSERRPDLCPERALLVWSPIHTISNKRLDEFVQVAKDKYSYNVEQALGMLFWHKHDLERAMQDLANFTPFPDEWSVEDKVLFEQAFQFHGKSFHRIRQMLPDKSIAALVKYYYSWKKTRTRTSLMDRQAKKLQSVREEGRYEDMDTFVDNENETAKEVSLGGEEGGDVWELQHSVSQHTLNTQGSDVRHLPRLLAENRTDKTDHRSPQEGRSKGKPESFPKLDQTSEGDAYQPRRLGMSSYGSPGSGGVRTEESGQGGAGRQASSTEQQTTTGFSQEKN